MNISIIEPAGQEYGSEMSLLDILRGLNKEKFITEVIIPKGSKFKKRLDEFNIKNKELLYIDLYKGRNVNRPFSYAQIIFRWLFKRPDVIIVNQAGILRGIAFCNYLFRKPVICFVTTLEDAEHISSLKKWVFRNVHNLICNSEYTANKVTNIAMEDKKQIVYRGYLSDKSQVVYCGYLSKNLFSERPPWNLNDVNQRFTIGILGRICKSKGHDVLISTLKHLQEKGSKWLPWLDIIFIGNYQQAEKDEMQKLILQSPVKIEVTGYCTDITPELTRLHLLLIPSIAEPFGRIVQEAADAGLPVIASKSGGLGEICSKFNYGTLFKYPDIQQLGALIEYNIENYSDILAASLKSRQNFLAQFEFAHYLERIEQTLTESVSHTK